MNATMINAARDMIEATEKYQRMATYAASFPDGGVRVRIDWDLCSGCVGHKDMAQTMAEEFQLKFKAHMNMALNEARQHMMEAHRALERLVNLGQP